MFIKKFKRKCDIRGCKNTANVYLFSKRREMGGTVAMCTDCLKEAQKAVDGFVEEKKTAIKVNKPLFPHPEIDVTPSSVAEIEPEPQEVIEEVTEDIPISVAEDSVTNEEHTPPSSSSSPTSAPLPSRAKTTNSGAKKKPNKKK